MQKIGQIKYVTDRLVEGSPYRDDGFLSREGRTVVFEGVSHADGIDHALGAIAEYSESVGDALVFSGFIPIEKTDSEEALRGIETFCSRGIQLGSHVKGGSRLFRLWADYLLRAYDGHCKAESADYCAIFGLETKQPLHLSNVELSIARVYLRHRDPESLETAKKVLGTAIKRKDVLTKGNRIDSARYLSVLTELFAEDSYVSYKLGDMEKSKNSSDEAAAFASALEERMDKTDMRDLMALIDAFSQKALLMQEGIIPTEEKTFQKLMEVTKAALALPASHAGTFRERLEDTYRLAIR